ncbi:MAG: DUF2279 domain-containing protein [Bacteroidetes bacterium HGW-Bacteroidetes-21]|nr:MAG: DUF2279 domain-containing protein [Bacteroidetes bacterium HGW-Bacteroidetes-21]
MGQSDSLSYKRQKAIFFTTAGVTYAGSLSALSYTWYSKYDKAGFHWFNDNKEWLQMDKCGHSFSAYQLSSALFRGFEYAGYSRKNALIYASLSSQIAMASIEVFDGFSAKWGASWGDLLANLSGTSLFTIQKALGDEQWIIPKFSFLRSDYYTYRPDALGSTLSENILKDYNGQTYWLSFPLQRIHQKIPGWICLSIGYGANGLISGNQTIPNGQVEEINFERYRQYYLSADINFSAIKTNNKILKSLFKTINILKLPFPAFELSQRKITGHLLCF